MKRGARKSGPDSIAIQEMSLQDVPAVAAIEKVSLPIPWGERSFRNEILENPVAGLFVVRRQERKAIIGFACVWLVDREMRINSLAVHPGWRKRGIGRRFLRFLLEYAVTQGCSEAMLEVRPSNGSAIGLYRAAGFAAVGRRKGYYTDTDEDAVVMHLRLPSRDGVRA